MSLLHEALKKAEREGEADGTPDPFVDQEEGKKLSLRLYLLGVLAVISLGVVAWLALHRKALLPQGVQPVPVVAGTPLGIAGGPGVADLAKQAEALLREENWAEAKKVIEKWVVFEPSNPEAYNSFALALKKQGMKDKAYEQYKKALAIKPDYPEAENNLGALYLTDNKLAEAETQFRRAIAQQPNYPEPYFHLGLIAEAEGKGSVAKENYQKFLDLSPQLEPQFSQEIKNRIEELGAAGP